MLGVLREFFEATPYKTKLFTKDHFVIWHTHPGGMVGPSQGDMQQRLLIGTFRHIVVTLPDGECTEY